MNYGIYILRGNDATTESEASLSLKADSVPSAIQTGYDRGLVVRTVETPSGVLYDVQDDGTFCKHSDSTTTPSSSDDPDLSLKLLSFLIPLVGFVAGATRLGNRDNSGKELIGWAMGGIVLWIIFGIAVI